MYKIGDVESGATMTVNFKTMPYSNNKYNFSEPYLIYDMVAEVAHEGNVIPEPLSGNDLVVSLFIETSSAINTLVIAPSENSP